MEHTPSEYEAMALDEIRCLQTMSVSSSSFEPIRHGQLAQSYALLAQAAAVAEKREASSGES